MCLPRSRQVTQGLAASLVPGWVARCPRRGAWHKDYRTLEGHLLTPYITGKIELSKLRRPLSYCAVRIAKRRLV